MTNACKTLVVIDEKSDVFEFAHLSVREYLNQREGYNQAECHLAAARSCLRAVDDAFGSSMINRTMSESEKGCGRYASLYWPVHYQNIDFNSADERIGEIRDTLKDLLIQGQDTTPAFKQWLIQIQELAQELSTNQPLSLKIGSLRSSPETSLFTACVFGFPDVIEQFGRDRHFNFDQCNDQRQIALCLAVENNQLETVRSLLARSRVDVNRLNVWAVVQFEDLLKLGKRQIREQVFKLGERKIRSLSTPDMRSGETLRTVICFASALQAGAFRGHQGLTDYLLEQGANVNLVTAYYGSALQAAAVGGHEYLVKGFLVRYQAEPNSQGGFYGNALQAAASRGSVPIISLLLDYNALVSTPGGHYGSALMAAICGGHVEAVKTLLNAGADMNVYSEAYGIPLQRAADLDNEELLQLLIKKGANINAHRSSEDVNSGVKNGSVLAIAAFGGHKKMVSLLLRNGAETDLKYDGSGPHILHKAATFGMIDLVEHCLKSHDCKIDMPHSTTLAMHGDTQIMTPLACACVEGNLDIVRLLLERGAAIEYPGDTMTLLNSASRRDHAKIVTLVIETMMERAGHHSTQRFIDRGLPHSNDTALHEAARTGSVECLKILLDHDAAYTKNSKEVTPLQAAAYRDHPHVIQELLDRNDQQGINGYFNLNSTNILGRTALMDASQQNILAVAKVLLQHAVRDREGNPGNFHSFVNQRDISGRTALYLAAEQDNVRIVEQLVNDYQADYTIRRDNLATPLHMAVCQGHYASADKLLSHASKDLGTHRFNSFLNAVNIHHNTALIDAVVNDKPSLVPLLLNTYGADYLIGNKSQVTPLHIAACNGNIPILESLAGYVAAQKDEKQLASFVNAKNMHGKTALHDACERGRTQVIEILLKKYNVDYILVDNDGSTALHWGVKKNRSLVYRLLDIVSTVSGRDYEKWHQGFLNNRDKKSQTAMDLAKSKGLHHFVELLRNQYGAM